MTPPERFLTRLTLQPRFAGEPLPIGIVQDRLASRRGRGWPHNRKALFKREPLHFRGGAPAFPGRPHDEFLAGDSESLDSGHRQGLINQKEHLPSCGCRNGRRTDGCGQKLLDWRCDHICVRADGSCAGRSRRGELGGPSRKQQASRCAEPTEGLAPSDASMFRFRFQLVESSHGSCSTSCRPVSHRA